MPTNSNVDKKETQKMYDKDVARFAKRIAMAYSSDKIRLVTSRNVRRAVLLHDIDAINDVIRDIPNMPDGFRSDFCDAFIGEDMSGLDLATPAILGYAYRAISARVQNGDKSQQVRLNKLAKRIDDLSADFANSGGMVVRQNEWPLINMSNIANENEDFAIMLDARMADASDEKQNEIKANSDYAKKIAKDYDEAWNLNKLKPTDVDKLSERWNKIYKILDHSVIRDDIWEKLIKCKMLDSKGDVIPQFGDKNGVEYKDYKKGFEILDDSRYEAIIELVKHDIAKRYVADVNAKIDEVTIENEFNAELLIKLYEIYAADQIAQGATETPEQFADQEFRESFEKMLEPDGDGIAISDNGYNVAIETQTDATVGWFARLRNKVGGNGKNLKKLWKEVNRSLEYVDDMADVRMSRAAVERRKQRRNFAGRIITGFGSSFIASALVTVGATAAAAKAGKSLAWGSAYVGGGAALGIMAFQIARWIRNQKKNNLPVSWEEFKKNKQLVRSLETSGLAIAAMVLSALGLAGAAMAVGIGAVALGAYNNGRRILQSAQDSGMSQRQKIAWTIASVASVIVGALGGRMGAQWGIGKYNEWNPDNAWFNNKTAVPGEPKKVADEITHERIIRHYPDNMIESAKGAVEGWYAHDYPNHPEILQQDIDAVNQYNLDHDTNLDPYRILRAMKISQPSRLAYTPAWSDTYNVPQELISQAAHAVGGGVYDPAGMEAAKFLDANYLGESGNVGAVPPGHTINKTYSPITELPTETTETVIDQVAKYEPTYDVRTESVDVRAGYGAFGNYSPRERKSNLRDRVGSFLDRIHSKQHNEPVTEEVQPVIDNEEEKIPTFTLDEPQEQQLPPVTLDERDKELSTTGENTPSPVRRKEYVPPVVNLSQLQQVPDLRLKDMTVALTIPEIKKYEPYYDFALTEDQAERWNTLNKELGTTLAKMRNRSTHADDYMRLRKQANRLTDEINSFTAELGNPSAFEIEQALTEIERRKKLKDLIAQYERHTRNEPSGDSVPEWRIQKWKSEQAKLVDKIEALGGWNSLDESNLRFATQKPGRLEQKRAEIAQREADRQQQPQRVFEMPLHKQQKPEQKREEILPELLGNTDHVEFMPEPLMEVRGVPVKLVDLSGHNNPIIKNGDHAMAVVDVYGLRIPFFLANGNEGSNSEERTIEQGKWYPVFTVSQDGRLFFGTTNGYLAQAYNSKNKVRKANEIWYLTKIADELNSRYGDVRENYFGNLPQIDLVNIVNILKHEPKISTGQELWGGIDTINLYPPFVKRYFDHVRALGYTKEQEKQDQRKERYERWQRDIERRRQNWQNFVSGTGDFVERARGRIRMGLFGRNDDLNEHK